MSASSPSIALAAADPTQVGWVERHAAEIGIPVVEPGASECDLLLVKTAKRLELRQLGPGAPGPVSIDFTAGKAAHRLHYGGGRGQPLARAVGLKKGRTPCILDLTAGLGRDAFVLASLGCRVTLLERSPVIAALLQDALERAADDPDAGPIVERMGLIRIDAGEYLASLPPAKRPDVIYLDPMYPHRSKSALVKKEMRLFRLLVGDDEDSVQLLGPARRAALLRVVVKRPAKAPTLDGERADLAIRSPNTRYDVYLGTGA